MNTIRYFHTAKLGNRENVNRSTISNCVCSPIKWDCRRQTSFATWVSLYNLLLSSPTIIHRKLLQLAIPVDRVFLSWKLDIALQFRAKPVFFLYLLYKEIAKPFLSSYQRNSIHSFPLLFLLIPSFKKNKLFYNFLFYKVIESLFIDTTISSRCRDVIIADFHKSICFIN